MNLSNAAAQRLVDRIDRLEGRMRDLERSIGRIHQLLAELRVERLKQAG
jgi:hypothetical protein